MKKDKFNTICFLNKTEKRHILCIDPGKSGGIVVMHGTKTFGYAMPDDPDLRDAIEGFSQCEGEKTAYLELVGGYIAGKAAPGSAMFNFGDGYGYVRGLLAAHRIPLVLVRPQAWQKGIPGIQGKKEAERKRALKEHAARVFPEHTITLKTADAFGILHWARSLPLSKEELNRQRAAELDAQEEAERLSRARAHKRLNVASTTDTAAQLDSLSFADQMAKAEEWCQSNGWAVPVDPKEKAEMFTYWESLALNGEA